MTEQQEAAMRQALKFVVAIHPAFICEAMNHTKEQRHTSLEPCPHVGTQQQVAEALRQALEQPDDEIDWKDQYEKQKRRAEMWVAKYEKDIGPVEMAVPMQQSEALKLADALEQDTRGYEPVTDAARELRRLYAENQRLKAQPADEPVAWQLSPTDIYDFAGWLTTRKGVMTVGSSCEAGPMAEAVGEYLKTFPERFNTRPQPAAPEWWPAIENILKEYGLQAIDFVADFKAAMKDAEQPAASHSVGVNATTWRGLTDEEINDVVSSLTVSDDGYIRFSASLRDYARAIEAKLKEKNHV